MYLILKYMFKLYKAYKVFANIFMLLTWNKQGIGPLVLLYFRDIKQLGTSLIYCIKMIYKYFNVLMGHERNL